MKQLNRFSAVFAAIALVAVVGCAETATRVSTGQYVDDSAITTRVKAAMFKAPSLKSTQINVETYKGQVQLSGFVSSQDDINQAVAVAQGVNGVTSVRNDMRLK